MVTVFLSSIEIRTTVYELWLITGLMGIHNNAFILGNHRKRKRRERNINTVKHCQMGQDIPRPL